MPPQQVTETSDGEMMRKPEAMGLCELAVYQRWVGRGVVESRKCGEESIIAAKDGRQMQIARCSNEKRRTPTHGIRLAA